MSGTAYSTEGIVDTGERLLGSNQVKQKYTENGTWLSEQTSEKK